MQISQQDAAQLLRGIVIPPRPAVMLELAAEREQPTLEPGRIAEIISQDVSLSAAILKTVNSPFFSLPQRVASVRHAVLLLGAPNAISLATGLALRNTLNIADNHHVQRFWETAALDAQVAAFIATQLNLPQRDQTYTFGLFQNCGIPLLLARFKDYQDTLDLAYASRQKPFTTIEQERHGTHHAIVGHLVARCWYLPEEIGLAILMHHDPALYTEPSEEITEDTRVLVAVTKLAEQIAHSFLHLPRDQDWQRNGSLILEYLGLSQAEYAELCDDVQQLLEAGR
ncbi:HDOD domain-containing protein [Chitinivorax sp. PXF-14]|uniref:HDOD domain-containing protein n=1 Tax=Chitinivorax sp. PXF-14 TaxID=3230488 RepID=UPI003465C338